MSANPKIATKTVNTEINPDAKTRRCLMCGDKFPSQWAGERVCSKCKSSSAWRSG